MGAYSELRIGQLGFDWWKNDIDPSIMVLFTKADKQVSAISLEDWMAAGGDKDAWSPDRCEVKYICSIAVMRDRLDLKGFTLAVAEESFRLGVQRRVPELTESIQGFADPEMITLAQERGLPYPDPDYAEHERKTLEILQEITPQAWCEALRSAADHLPHSLVK